MQQNVVIPIDHSIQSENAVRFYLERLHRPGNRLVLVRCIELPEPSLNKARDSLVSPAILTSLWKEEEEKNKDLEARMTSLLKQFKVPGVLRMTFGKSGELICRVAEEEKAVLIVVATQAMSKMKRTLLGSVSDFVAGHATCPVLICPDPLEVQRKRQSSGGNKKTRHFSGDSVQIFTSRMRHRFASGSKCLSGSRNSDHDQLCDDAKDI